MHFDADAFISYAHLDDVGLVEGHKGWVSNLHRALEVRVGQLLGKSPQIWRDLRLNGNDVFAETLLEQVRRVAVLISIVSPRYIKSEWALRELAEFWTAAEARGGIRVRDKACVFKVLKTPVPLDKTPPLLRSLLGYEFFKIDPATGKIRELDEVFGPDAQRDFWVRLDDLAHDICSLLELLEAPDARPAGIRANGDGQTTSAVFVAETTTDLWEQREAVRRELQQHGYTVLPDRTLPHIDGDLQAAVSEDLARCRMSIHMIGRKYSLVPEGGVESLIEIQHELAIARGQSGGFSRLLWIPQGLHIDDERQRRVVDRLRLDPRPGGRADLLETYFEDLRTAIHTWLADESRTGPLHDSLEAPAPRLYLVADQRDAGLLGPWTEGLFDAGFEVLQPVFDGDEAEIREYHEENLATCNGVLIFYGAGNELWLRRKLRELQKSAGYGRTKRAAAAVCLIPPRTPGKERFRSHEVPVIPQWEGFVPDLLRSFLAQLKAGRSV